MNNTIHSLRQRPDHHKKIIAAIVSAAVTASVFSIWFTSHQYFSSDTAVIAKTETPDKSPLSVFGDNVASGFSAFKGLFK